MFVITLYASIIYRDWQLLAVTGDNNIVTPDTHILFLLCHYSFVFVVDMSPSMAAVVCGINIHMQVLNKCLTDFNIYNGL